MRYLHLGGQTIVNEEDIIGIFDLDNTSQSFITRKYLASAEKNGNVINVAEDIPKTFIVCENKKNSKIFLSQMSTITLSKRAEENLFET